MMLSRRVGVSAALLLGLAACAGPETKQKPRSVWGIEDGTTVVHNPSGIRAPRQAGKFHFVKKYEGEREDLVVIYDAAPQPGGVRVYFSGLMPPVAQPCETVVARRAERVGQRAEFTRQIGAWTTLEPLFPGMEAGRAAVYDSDVNMEGASVPTRSELYILCGGGGTWFLEYRADYPRDGEGSGWIRELIAETAPD